MTTKKPTHTPGPWSYSETRKKTRNHDRVIDGPDGIEVAYALDMNRHDMDAQVDANARLIAAAPELLAALVADSKHVHSAFECGEDRKACPVEAMKRHAIARAEGK
jgi:hypothetical protein